MEYRTLGSSGAVVSAYALGTMTFGAKASEETSHLILDDYLDAGGNFLDTADVYSQGVSEEIIGRWLGSRSGARDRVVLATKGRFPMGKGPNDLGTSRRHLGKALDDSLRRLGVEQIDLYQMHAWDPITPLEETLRFLHDSVCNGKIAYYGFSNFLGWQLTKAVHLAKAHGWNLPVTLQPQYNLLVRDIELEIVPAALDAGIGLLPWSPLGGGWLSGKYRRDVDPTGATRLGENPKRGMEAWEARNADEHTWRVLDAVEATASLHSVSQSQVALAWLAGRPAVTSVILGARTRDQLADNLAAADLELTTEDIERLNGASNPRLGVYPYGPNAQEQRSRKIAGGR
ncbi:aldo/keto reductase [Arthrobacter celericrescens]|uniref:aldo/keto reductase n=1 Tax=Arthrobacter celericrescens TaxID=2320851 RepID=UPI000EA2E40B|nr:aldo/keto reductase [Arthrobacter celericrescens]